MTVPKLVAIQELFGMLLDRDVRVTKADGKHSFLKAPSVLGVYVDDKDGISCACACDLALTMYAGAALAMLPAGLAAEATMKGQLDGQLRDNTFEVLNVMASLFPSAGGPHVRLVEVVDSPPLPKKLAPMLMKPSVRVDLDVTVAGYEGGRMILFAA